VPIATPPDAFETYVARRSDDERAVLSLVECARSEFAA
jgi:hypothetical protein